MKNYFLFIVLFFSFQQNTFSKDIFTEFLVAKPNMQDPRFKETVIVMLYHNQEKGAAGLVINKPLQTMHIRDLFNHSNIMPPKNILKKEITLHWGGPVEPEQIFIIHSSDYESNDFISTNQNFTLTQSPKVLLDIATNNKPKHYIILSGIAIWEPGQLDSEMIRGDWYKKQNNYTSLFDDRTEIWNNLVYSQDI